MKRQLLKLAVVFGVLALAAQAQALAIGPGTDTPLTGDQTAQSQIDDAIAGTLGTSAELYKASPGEGGGESGSLADSYETTFIGTPTDFSGALIEYVGGDVVGPEAFLLVKDGYQGVGGDAWYLFNLTNLAWNGTDDLELSGFWPNGGSISHVTLYGNTTSVPEIPVPEPGTLLLLGSGLVGLALYGRKTFKR